MPNSPFAKLFLSPTVTLPVNYGTLLLQSTEEAHLAAEKPRSGGDELAIIERWPDALGELHARIVHRFLRPEVGERARPYLAGLLGGVGRKNGFYEKAKLAKSRRGGGDRPPRTSTAAPLRLLLSAFALGQLSSRPDA